MNINSSLLQSKVKNLYYRSLPRTLYAGRYFKKNYGYKFDSNNPQTFNEKLWWLHLYNRDPLTTKCTDKVLVRDYVAEKGLSHILNDVYAVYSNPDEINLDNLPNEFFLKCNHFTDGNVWCKDKESFPMLEVNKKLKRLLKKNLYWNSREWNYKNIEPKILCEKVLKDEHSNYGLVDYRFFCFDGKAEFLCVDIDTTSLDGSHFSGAKRNVYDLNFQKMDVKIKRPNFNDELLKKPKNFEAMIEYANILSEPFAACRVDFYNIDGRIVFGELTFHHGGAHDISPEEYQQKWGNLINLESPKIVTNKKRPSHKHSN